MNSNKFVLAVLYCSILGFFCYLPNFFTNELVIIENSARKVEDENVKQLSHVVETQAKINKVPWLVSRMLLTENEDNKKIIEKRVLNQIREVEQDYSFSLEYHAGKSELYEYVFKNWVQYKQSVLQLISLHQEHRVTESKNLMENSLLYLERVNDGMKMLVEFHERDVVEKTNNIVNKVELSKKNVVIFASCGLVIFLFIGFVSFKKIISTENKLTMQVAKMAKNNLLLVEQSKEIYQLAYHDTLTGLPNRLYFQNEVVKELKNIEQKNAEGAVVFMDMDNFKIVNDTYGHDIGDEFLKVIANRIKSLVNTDFLGARFGGDEFALFLRGVGEQATQNFWKTY